MEQIKIENLSFSYPLSDKKALNNISLNIKSGEFILLCGESGCGKTTLLKQLKKELSPHGEKSGKIYIDGKSVDELTLGESARKTGFVMQNPDMQIVTDKVWHELSFGLQNLGISTSEIRLRTAEAASFFGINEWFDKNTAELSGGQKQLLNLASVMAMSPDILLLDEPTSQLDPIAAESFLFTVGKINRELGTTVIISEQRLEEVFAYADRVVVMDGGKAVFDGTPEEVGCNLNSLPCFLCSAVPTPMRIFGRFGGEKCPVTVRDGRAYLEKTNHKNEYLHNEKTFGDAFAVELKDICMRYEKNGKDVLKNLNLKIPENTFFAVLGGNGTGKTTLINIISSVLSPYSGKIKIFGKSPKKSDVKIAVLPQEPEALFTEKTVFLDLKQTEKDEKKIAEISRLLKLEELLTKHPYDLSGGEQQRTALAKVLLCKPKILLLDEPTKGMDSGYKKSFANLIKSLTEKGCTVIMISHDVEFCAKYADFCAMLFDGEISAAADSHKFFNENRFYTTAANRMSRGIICNAVTEEDICLCLQEK